MLSSRVRARTMPHENLEVRLAVHRPGAHRAPRRQFGQKYLDRCQSMVIPYGIRPRPREKIESPEYRCRRIIGANITLLAKARRCSFAGVFGVTSPNATGGA